MRYCLTKLDLYDTIGLSHYLALEVGFIMYLGGCEYTDFDEPWRELLVTQSKPEEVTDEACREARGGEAPENGAETD